VRGGLLRAIDELAATLERSRRIVTQTRRRLAGAKPDPWPAHLACPLDRCLDGWIPPSCWA